MPSTTLTTNLPTHAPGYVAPDGDTVLIGCGNLLRGDDAAGPLLVRYLWEAWGETVPSGIRVVDGGTAGMDVAFQMRGARRVILVDACLTGEAPGTLYKVPGNEVENLPPVDGLHLHAFRWDHALAFARWLLKDDYPTDITVYLIEAAQTDFGAPLSDAVERTTRALAADLARDLAGTGTENASPTVELRDDGYLLIPQALAADRFPNDLAFVTLRDGELWLLPVRGPGAGGFILKHRNAAGDRAVLIIEALPPDFVPGERAARWDDEACALRLPLPRSDAAQSHTA